MNRKQYEDELHNLLRAGQALSQRIRILMNSFEETASCAEWNMLGQVVMSVGTANDALFTALYPKPSALVEDTAVCRTCGFADCPGARGGDCPRWPARDQETRTMDQVHDA